MATFSSDRRVVWTAFTFAVFGWGLGFYGPPIFFSEILRRTDWNVNSVAWVLTIHHLTAAAVILKVPRWHELLGVVPITLSGIAAAAVGIVGWSLATSPFELAMCAVLSGGGWGCTGGASITAVVARWYAGPRAAGLTMAYNGATLGGAAFSVIWPLLIDSVGFTTAALISGSVACAAVAAAARWGLDDTVRPAAAAAASTPPQPRIAWGCRLYTLALGTSLSLFAQIGVLAHLFTLMVPRVGSKEAGWLIGGSVAMALLGRQVSWRFGMRRHVHPRAVLAAFLAAQCAGCALLATVPQQGLFVLISGCVLFGIGIGTATSLPTVIAQHEFDARLAARAISVTLSASQATYSFAPAAFGAILAQAGSHPAIGAHTTSFFIAAACLELAAAASVLSVQRTTEHSRT